jgi:transposase, IS30 family
MVRPLVLRSVERVFWRAIAAGLTQEAAGAAAGVSRQTANRWFGQAGGMSPVDLEDPPARGRFLSAAEREEIAIGIAAGQSHAAIAARLGRHRSTIGREVKRNRLRRHPGGYRALLAQSKAEARARRPKPRRLATNARLRERVQEGLAQRWSPQQIVARLREEFPEDEAMRISHEAIYQALYVQGRGGLRRELTACLRTGRALRKPRRRVDARQTRIKDMVMISDRPAEAADRAVPGHWEGDLIIGTNNGSAIGTLVERSTRFVMLLHLPTDHGALAVRDAMIEAMLALPAHLRRSLTWDQGIEMAAHTEISVAADLPIYFCDPASPWQRGSNENTNGLLRQYFPKATDLSVHTRAHLDAVAAELNGRPRKTLDWRTPAEALQALLSAA